MPSMHTIVMVALLPIPIKHRNSPQKRLDEQQQTNREVLNEVLRRLLQPLAFKQNPNAESGYYNVLCADGNFRRCKLVLAGWLADCPEYRDLHHLERHVSLRGECPKNELGDYVPSEKHHPRRDHNVYRMLSDVNTKAADAELSSRHVHWGFKVFRHILSTMSDLLKPDILHTMQIGMLDYLQKWISTPWRRTNGLTSTTQSGYPCLLITTSHQKISHKRKFLNGMGRRWKKWAGTCLEL